MIITLCGSTKFKNEFEKANKELTLKGIIVLSCGVYSHSDNEIITEEQKKMLDELHRRKIDLSDGILVLNVGGYIGDSTKSEIDYALKKGKAVRFLEVKEEVK
jgi:hypothetical protein